MSPVRKGNDIAPASEKNQIAASMSTFEAALELRPFVGRVRVYTQRSRSRNTIRGYQGDWRHFSEFCQSLGLISLPARPELVASYLTLCADSGLKVGSIQRRVSAIAAMHAAVGHDSPTFNPVVKLSLAGIKRSLGMRQEGKRPTLTADIAAMCSHISPGLLGVRDRAILLFGFAGGFRRSELVALDVDDVRVDDEGARVTVRRS